MRVHSLLESGQRRPALNGTRWKFAPSQAAHSHLLAFHLRPRLGSLPPQLMSLAAGKRARLPGRKSERVHLNCKGGKWSWQECKRGEKVGATSRSDCFWTLFKLFISPGGPRLLQAVLPISQLFERPLCRSRNLLRTSSLEFSALEVTSTWLPSPVLSLYSVSSLLHLWLSKLYTYNSGSCPMQEQNKLVK